MFSNLTKNYLLVVSMAAVLIFSACTKDEIPRGHSKKCIVSGVEYISPSENIHRTMEITYDASDRVAGYDWSDGDYIHIAYNSVGLIQEIKVSYKGDIENHSYTWEGRKATRSSNWLTNNVYDYNFNGELTYMATHSAISNVRLAYKMYAWKSGNMTHENTFNPEGVLEVLQVNSYDQFTNPFETHRFLGLITWRWPEWVFPAKNNRTLVNWKSNVSHITTSTGELAEQYGPVSILYNMYGYPEKMIFSDNRHMVLIYKECE
jgi:hypothetical protein